jgi:hypothetical protein
MENRETAKGETCAASESLKYFEDSEPKTSSPGINFNVSGFGVSSVCINIFYLICSIPSNLSIDLSLILLGITTTGTENPDFDIISVCSPGKSPLLS